MLPGAMVGLIVRYAMQEIRSSKPGAAGGSLISRQTEAARDETLPLLD
jgi:hypothetical protein